MKTHEYKQQKAVMWLEYGRFSLSAVWTLFRQITLQIPPSLAFFGQIRDLTIRSIKHHYVPKYSVALLKAWKSFSVHSTDKQFQNEGK